MDFTYTPEQEALRDSVRRFVEREYNWERRVELIRSETGVAAAHWPVFAELGWLGAGLSEEQGGFGGGAAENALIAEELGRGLVTEPFLAHVGAVQALAAIGGEVAADRIAAMVMGEARIVPALHEAEGRGDESLIAAEIVIDGGAGVLHGAKSLVEGAAKADSFIVSVREAGVPALYLIDAAASGVTRRDYRTLDNRRVADLGFAGVAVRPDQCLARGAEAEAAIARSIDDTIVALCGEALGVMDAALWATRDYLKVRRQFGTTLGSFQALQHRMADMLIEVELARSILFHAIGAMAEESPRTRRAAASAAKVQIARSGLFVGAQAIQLHGGIGVTEELNISHFYRRLYVIARQFGDADAHLDRFAAAFDQAA